MSIDLNFWKYKPEVFLDNIRVYHSACCDGNSVEGLEMLPIDAIMTEITSVFSDWKKTAPYIYECTDRGSFEIFTTPQIVRFDCYSMVQADMKRFSAIMKKFDCPLYDPQQGVRFDKILVQFHNESVDYETIVRKELAGLLPHLAITTESIENIQPPQPISRPQHPLLEIYVHRAKVLTKVTSNIFAGSFWSSRPCQCKTALLEDITQAPQILTELIQKSIRRAVADIIEHSYY